MLQNRYALITGSTRGIGRAVAETFAQNGANVALTSRHPQDSNRSRPTCVRGFPSRCWGKRATSPSRPASPICSARCAAGRPTGSTRSSATPAFHFLGELWDTPLDQTPEAKLESWYLEVFRVDTLGSVFCTYEALPLMMRQGGGSILYVSSTPALQDPGGALTVARRASSG